jgi:hypothetical protein
MINVYETETKEIDFENLIIDKSINDFSIELFEYIIDAVKNFGLYHYDYHQKLLLLKKIVNSHLDKLLNENIFYDWVRDGEYEDINYAITKNRYRIFTDNTHCYEFFIKIMIAINFILMI